MEPITPQQLKYLHTSFKEVALAFALKGYGEAVTNEADAKLAMKERFKVVSIKALTKEDASLFIHQIQNYCWTRLGYYLPDPREPSVLLATADKETGAVIIQ